jgi:putative transposase
MQPQMPLEPGQYYHIYDRGNNRGNISREERNYAYFMRLWAKHIDPVADTFAYCLMRNHFHFLVQIKTELVLGTGAIAPSDSGIVIHRFNNLLNGYAKAISKAYGRTGSLFQKHFGRKAVTSDRYFLALIAYIHRSPQKHGFVEDFRTYPYSSCAVLVSDRPTRLKRAQVLLWFGGSRQFTEFHQALAAPALPESLMELDEDQSSSRPTWSAA